MKLTKCLKILFRDIHMGGVPQWLHAIDRI